MWNKSCMSRLSKHGMCLLTYLRIKQNRMAVKSGLFSFPLFFPTPPITFVMVRPWVLCVKSRLLFLLPVIVRAIQSPLHGTGLQTLGSLSTDVFEPRTSTGSLYFSFCTFSCPTNELPSSHFSIYNLIFSAKSELYAPKRWSFDFRLTSVAQKRLCLSSLFC